MKPSVVQGISMSVFLNMGSPEIEAFSEGGFHNAFQKELIVRGIRRDTEEYRPLYEQVFGKVQYFARNKPKFRPTN